MTPELLTEIRNRADRCRSIAHGPNALLRALASADDVPVLLAEVERLRSALQIADGTTGRRTAERDRARGERDDALITIRALVGHPEPSTPETFEQAAEHILGETDEDLYGEDLDDADPSGTEAGQ